MRSSRRIFLATPIVLTSLVRVEHAAAKQAAGVTPTALRIPKALVNTSVEPLDVNNGVPEDPSGTWVAGWYKTGGTLGAPGNVQMYGLPDYRVIGPAVFWFLGKLAVGDQIEVTGDDDNRYEYQVSSVTTYEAASAPLDQIFGSSADERLTLYTWTPPYDNNGKYLDLVVVVANPRNAGSSIPSATATGVAASDDADCPIDPRLLRLPGGPPTPIASGTTARDEVNFDGADVAPEPVIQQIDGLLNAASACPIGVREALMLANGQVLALVGPPGAIPLSMLTSPEGPSSYAKSQTALAFILFAPDDGGWLAKGIPWYPGP